MTELGIIAVSALCATAFLVLSLVRRYYKWLTCPLNRLPGPGPSHHGFFLGAMPEIQKEAFMAPHKRWWKDAISSSGEDDKIPFIHYTTIFGTQNLVILDADVVKEVLTAPAGKASCRFPKKMPHLARSIGNGLITLNGPVWSRHRRIIQPSFSVGAIKTKLQATVPALVNQFIEQWNKADGREIDVVSHVSVLTLDVIGEVAFSHDFKGLQLVADWAQDCTKDQLAELNDPFMKSMISMLKPNYVRIILRQLGLGYVHSMLDPQTRNEQVLLNESVDSIIADAREKARSEEENGPHQVSSSSSSKIQSSRHKSLLQLLFDAKDTRSDTSSRTLSHEELRDELKTFLVAGHETTATWCYWCFFVLAQNKEIQRRVYEDISRHAPRSPDEPITLDHTDKMVFFGAFLKEVLRFYPPVGMIFRFTGQDEVLAGHKVPKNTRLVLSSHLIHRHPAYWKDPLVFCPERWLKKDKVKKHTFAFIPFSGGGRNCIGQHFAEMEVKLLMVPIIRAFTIDVTPDQVGTEFKYTAFVTTKSKPSLKIIVHRRKE